MFQKMTVALAIAFAGSAGAQVIWDEAFDGDLSDDDFAPTFLGELNMGVSIVRGMTQPLAGGAGTDAFGYDIPMGGFLDSVILTFYTPATGGTSGMVFYDSSAGANGVFLGGASYGGSDVGTDILFGSTGLDSLVGSAATSIREFGGPDATWELEFNVVPAPASAVLLGLGGIAAIRRRR
ncbi:MAG: hypothetical protein COB69_01950 [Phycisphaera sp.]|nr:MAG: hypothetical protein COB69_01950 [Phycisphaera sp.]